MPSRRFVDRGFWKCRELNGHSAHARLLAIYLFSEEADDYGRCKDDPYRFRHGAFPDDRLTDEDVLGLVEELVDAGFLARYESRAGRPLLWIRRFIEYQPMRYRAASHLDRHPDDQQEIVGRDGKATGVLAPVGCTPAQHGTARECAEQSGAVRECSAPIPRPILDVDVDRVPHKPARRKASRRGGKGVLSQETSDTATAIPEGVVPVDWRFLMKLTGDWPVAGKTSGLKRLEAILRANGPKDAEAWVRKAERGWKKGELKIGPWAVLVRGWQPSDTLDRGGGRGTPQAEAALPRGSGTCWQRRIRGRAYADKTGARRTQ